MFLADRRKSLTSLLAYSPRVYHRLHQPTSPKRAHNHPLEHRVVHREGDVAFDEIGLLARNPLDELRLRHRCIVAPSRLSRSGVAVVCGIRAPWRGPLLRRPALARPRCPWQRDGRSAGSSVHCRGRARCLARAHPGTRPRHRLGARTVERTHRAAPDHPRHRPALGLRHPRRSGTRPRRLRQRRASRRMGGGVSGQQRVRRQAPRDPHPLRQQGPARGARRVRPWRRRLWQMPENHGPAEDVATGEAAPLPAVGEDAAKISQRVLDGQHGDAIHVERARSPVEDETLGGRIVLPEFPQ